MSARRHQADVGIKIVSKYRTVTQLSPRSPQLQVIHFIARALEKRLFADAPRARNRREHAPTVTRCQPRTSIVADGSLQEVAIGIIVINTAKQRSHLPGLNKVAQYRVSRQAIVVKIEAKEVIRHTVASRPADLIIEVLLVRSSP